MDSLPKIMTVSYGTFSCRLEGFDDPFTTMKLVAEYFRKLAAQDRYFGGEPLQPDASILHQIAADANPFKVDAEADETGVTLRKADIYDAEERSRTASVPEDTPAPVSLPVFNSRRSAPVSADLGDEPDPTVDDIGESDGAEAVEDDTLVEATMFSSRRGPLTTDDREPHLPASAILADEDDDDDSYGQIDSDDDVDLDSDGDGEEDDEIPGADVLADIATDGDAPDTAQQDALADAEEDIAAEDASDPETADSDPAAQEADDAPIAVDEEEIAGRISSTLARQELSPLTPNVTDEDIQREEAALERLLETTNSKLEAPENERRGNALDRLKAAVAATEAERRLRAGGAAPRQAPAGRTPRPETATVDPETFKRKIAEVRKDHEEVVKFSRPTAKRGTQRPKGAFATLILGKDQRVSPDAEEAAGPTAKKPEAQGGTPEALPRLAVVGGADNDKPIVDQGFADFAKRIGATSLHDLLEASAAYLSIVEEEPRFSAERIIANITEVLGPDQVNPDATSRSMTRLMRDGRLLRVKADRYTLSKSARSGYQDRLAG